MRHLGRGLFEYCRFRTLEAPGRDRATVRLQDAEEPEHYWLILEDALPTLRFGHHPTARVLLSRKQAAKLMYALLQTQEDGKGIRIWTNHAKSL